MRTGLLAAGLLLISIGAVATHAHSAGTLAVRIHPNLDDARTEGFQLLAGHPPFAVEFTCNSRGGTGSLSCAWDFDGDGVADSNDLHPAPFLYATPGVYRASLLVQDEHGRKASAEQRIVVIGSPTLPGWRFGVVAHLNRCSGLYNSDAEREKAVDLIRDLGVDFARLDLPWAAIQPTQGSFLWEDFDRVLELAVSNEFDLLPIIGYSTEWASTAVGPTSWEDWFFAAPSSEDYAWFAYQAASRYSGRIKAWEIWHQPNLSTFWRPTPDPVEYAELLRDAYLAIKYASPDCAVVLGGLTSDFGEFQPEHDCYAPARFVEALYEEGAGRYFDAVGRHPHIHPTQGIAPFVAELKELRSVMVANGDFSKPIWLTGFGWHASEDSGVSEQLQADWMSQCLEVASSLDYVGLAIWYNLRNMGNSIDVLDHNYGLIRYDWSPKPAYRMFKEHILDVERD